MFNIDRDELYDVPIEKLNLTVKTYNILARQGITAVGDVLDLYIRLNYFTGAMISFPSTVWNIPSDELIVKVIEYLHDNHLEEND